MRRIYIPKEKTPEALEQITREQSRRGVFVNVEVKPYRGRKYDPEKTTVIQIG